MPTVVPTKEEMLATKAAEERYIKKRLVAEEGFKLVKEELAQCYMEHGVNHFVKCRKLREEYSALLKDPYLGVGAPEL